MSIIRITKEFSFEMSHVLEGYDGLCSQIHGHSYKLFVTVKGRPVVDEDDPKNGMVMDFGALKGIVNENIVNRYDHCLVIRRSESMNEFIECAKAKFQRIIITDYQPTCENMIAEFAAVISDGLPSGIELHSLKMHETASSYAEWFADDQ